MAKQKEKEVEATDVDFEDVNNDTTDNENDNQDNKDTEDVPDDNSVSSLTLQENNVTEVSLDTFTNVSQLKQFVRQMGISGNIESVAQRLLRAKELKIGMMQGLDNIYIINGKATLSVHLMNMLIKRAGYEVKTIKDNLYLQKDGSFQLKSDENSIDRVVELEFIWKSKITNEVERERYSYWFSEAKTAGLTDKDTWKKYTKQLLWARALTFGARRIVPEAVDMYEFGEMMDVVGKSYNVSEDGNATPIDITPKK